MKKRRIGVLIPAYNEASALSAVLAGIPSKLTLSGTSFKLVPIVIDDGSSDKTAKIALKNKGTVLIRHIINSGAGAATRTGILYLRQNDYQYGATMDADGQHDPADLEKILTAVVDGNCNIVVGSRLVNTNGMPWYKIFGNKGLNVLTKILLGVNSTDSQSGLKAFDKVTIDELDYRENGYAFCSEMLWRAHKIGLVVKEVPVRAVYTDYSKSKGQSNWNGFMIIKSMVRHRISDFSA